MGFFIAITTFITGSRLAASGVAIIASKSLCTICQERPNLSFSQPQICAFGSPPAESLSQ